MEEKRGSGGFLDRNPWARLRLGLFAPMVMPLLLAFFAVAEDELPPDELRRRDDRLDDDPAAAAPGGLMELVLALRTD